MNKADQKPKCHGMPIHSSGAFLWINTLTGRIYVKSNVAVYSREKDKAGKGVWGVGVGKFAVSA